MTQSLTLSRVSYSYPDAATSALFDVSATFPPGWTGIVGLNGCGKSTLARIACRHITPDAGNVSPHLSSAFCVQDAGCVPDALFDFTCDFAPEASLLRRTLNIADDMPWRFSELSCGEQKKIQIAVALWMNPDVLVVDEPTNHIDAVCRAEIQRALAKYCGIGLLISHDRDMLDALVRRCLCFEGGRAIMRPGTYTEAREQAAIEAQTATRTRENARAEVRKLAAEQQKRRQLADRTAARRSGKNLDARDSDGRAKLGLAIYTGQDGKAGKLAARMDARVETASERLASMHVDKRYEGNLWLSSAPSRRKVLLQLDEQAIPCGPNHKLLVPRLFLGNTDHLGIVGPNGAGKSTLLRHMMHQLAGESAASGRDPFPESGNAAANSGNSAPENARAASSSESGALDSASAARESVLNNATPPCAAFAARSLAKPARCS